MVLILLFVACSTDPTQSNPADDGDVVDGDDGGDDGGDGGADTGSTTEVGWEAVPLLSSSLLREEDEGGRLTVACMFALDGVLADPGVAATVSIAPMDGVVEADGVWTFADYGQYTVTCTTDIDGETVQASEALVVLTEVIDPDVAAVMGALDQTRAAHAAVALADGADDQAMVDAIAKMEAAGAASAAALSGDTASVYRPMPEGYWPSADELEAEGISRNADDDALAQALADWGDALRLVDETLTVMDPVALTEEDLVALEAVDAQAQAAGAALLALSPSAHGWLENKGSLFTELIEPAAQLNTTTAVFTDARLRSDAEDILPPFGLIGMALGAVNVGGLRGYYLSHVIAPVVAQLDLSINNLILIGLIEYLAPGDGGVSIEHIQASSSVAWALPGYDTWIYGSGFSETAALNKFIIVGVDWQEALGTIMDGCGIEDGDTVPEIVDDISDCMDTVNDAIENSQATPTEVVDDGVWGAQGVYIGPFPDVCGDGWVPITIGIMGMNMESGGRTAGFTTLNCIP